jgi:ketosteroid isomerase-like protein
MRKPFAGLLVLGLVALLPGIVSAQEPASPEASARRTLEAWVAMWNRYDLTQVDELFVADSSVTYFSSEREGLIRGIDSLRRHHAGFGFVPGGKTQPNRLRLEEMHITEEGEVVIATAVWYFVRGGEGGVTQRGPVSFVLVPRAGRHRIVHAQFGNYAR